MRGRKPIDSGTLRDIRKRLESGSMQLTEHDMIAQDLLQDIVWLASDYIGNSEPHVKHELNFMLIRRAAIVQKLFQHCSPTVRLAMLERIAPYLASIGCHKNGTWAAQK